MDEFSKVIEEEPPSIQKNRECLQSIGTDRLPNRVMRSSDVGCWQLVFICHSPGYKPYLGYHNSTSIYQNDEINS